MRLVWVLVGGIGGGLVGAALGFGGALLAMSFARPKTDGTFGMMEMIIGLPAGALLGLAIGLVWGFRTTLGGG